MIASGAISAEAATAACLKRIAETEPELKAWAHVDGEHAMAQARALDARRKSGAQTGALHGVPVGIKDVIDTAGMPTEYGSPLGKGRVPREDAQLVTRLRAAGAVIIGKTVTTELAFMQPSASRNPHDATRTPGGSSSGSAVAVAAGQVPLAVGTQTAGSVIRPASFCGVVGFKPSFGMIGRGGVLTQSPFLDTVGGFARSTADAALLVETMAGHDARDRDSLLVPAPRLLDAARQQPPLTPLLAVMSWPGAEPRMVEALAEIAEALGDRAVQVDAPPGFAEADGYRRCINLAEMAKCYYPLERRGRAEMSDQLRAALDEGKQILARDYIAALDWRQVLNAGLEELLSRCDAILCPAATGPAPLLAEGTTGSPAMNGAWTLCGVPAVTLPLLADEGGLPMGVQLIGRQGEDARLLRVANWLETALAEGSEPTGLEKT
ncbi:aspartyl-tRNA(Asn)/glutamyl-tRNA(Gln) amidotransferase subunit A [Paracoccus isoporae]|uniref:Aspartyl-tRNA(Asn)/glutamyl-tRNA(Gln) amidotransferase subunit A n=2 Tax=Paracoccus isoporae TaxID=591205 RepID=A0A1G6TG24_9RHOB|nr:aspartyl-tRNA(Asn)/glutamyl-tRNA(Gln) amidotransferase subunit A [Paracoccus isoporae]